MKVILSSLLLGQQFSVIIAKMKNVAFNFIPCGTFSTFTNLICTVVLPISDVAGKSYITMYVLLMCSVDMLGCVCKRWAESFVE